MKKYIILLALLLFAAIQDTFAQNTIFGNVVDAKTGSGIPGASVIIKGTNIAGVTNSSGNFGIMNVPNDAILQVSYIGYKTVELPIDNQTRFNVMLEPDVQILNEVVVTAERNQRETVTTAMGVERDPRSLPYAVRRVTGDDLRRMGGGSFTTSLAAAAPTLSIVKLGQGAGAPEVLSGRGGIIRLYIIDGIPVGNDSPNWLNPEEIEEVIFLKSANAAILYGSQAANGAIIITLKKR